MIITWMSLWTSISPFCWISCVKNTFGEKYFVLSVFVVSSLELSYILFLYMVVGISFVKGKSHIFWIGYIMIPTKHTLNLLHRSILFLHDLKKWLSMFIECQVIVVSPYVRKYLICDRALCRSNKYSEST